MKNGLIYILFISILSCFVSCEEIIELNIINAASEITVEANIADNEPAMVYLRKTASLADVDAFPAIEGAFVQISDSKGNKEQLIEVSPGFYKSLQIKGKSGDTFFLEVKTGDKTITSSDVMPAKVDLLSFRVQNTIYPGGGVSTGSELSPFHEIEISFNDPVFEQNFYKANILVNDTIRESNNIFDDAYNNGRLVTYNLVLFDENMQRGDSIHIEFMSISKSAYNYFQSMGNASGGPRSSASPANPYTNLIGAKLGYFSANTIERRYYIVK